MGWERELMPFLDFDVHKRGMGWKREWVVCVPVCFRESEKLSQERSRSEGIRCICRVEHWLELRDGQRLRERKGSEKNRRTRSNTHNRLKEWMAKLLSAPRHACQTGKNSGVLQNSHVIVHGELHLETPNSIVGPQLELAEDLLVDVELKERHKLRYPACSHLCVLLLSLRLASTHVNFEELPLALNPNLQSRIALSKPQGKFD